MHVDQSFDLGELFRREQTTGDAPFGFGQQALPIILGGLVGLPGLMVTLLAGPDDVAAVDFRHDLIFSLFGIFGPPAEFCRHSRVGISEARFQFEAKSSFPLPDSPGPPEDEPVMAISGSLSTLRAQAAKHPYFEKTFAYLDEVMRPGSEANKRLMAVGIGESKRIELGDGVFALEQSYNTKNRCEGKWESHLKYIDVQVVVAGDEIIELAETSHLELSENLTPAKDLLFYKEYNECSLLRMKAGEAAILFPPDGHKPGVRISDPVRVHKVVVKVPVF